MQNRFLLLTLLTVLTTGCATPPPASRTKQPVGFGSVPPGADVFVDGEHLGQTPIEGAMLSKATHRVTLRKAGYQEATSYIVPRPRNPFVHVLTLGFTMYTSAFDTLESHYTFTLEPTQRDSD